MQNAQGGDARQPAAAARRPLVASPAYRAFWSARTLSFLGDAMANVALVLIAAQPRPGVSAAWAVSWLLLAQTIPQTLGPLLGLLADRLDRRALMIALNLAQAAVVALLAAPGLPFSATLLLVAVLFLLATVFLPASQSVLPALLAEEALGEANAWLRLGLNVGLAVGPALAGFLLLVAGAPTVLLLDAATFLLSALLLARLPHLPPRTAPASQADAGTVGLAGVWAELREGFGYLRRQPIARTVTLGLFLVTLFVAIDNVGLIFLARESLRAGTTGYSVLLAGYGAGMVLGPLLLLRLIRRVPTGRLYWVSVGGMGAATLVCGLAPTLAIAALCQVLVGTSNGVENISYDTLLQRAVEPELRGRIFGAAYSAPYVALLLTYSVGGLLLELTSPRVVFVIGGAGTFGTALLLAALLRAQAARARDAVSQAR